MQPEAGELCPAKKESGSEQIAKARARATAGARAGAGAKAKQAGGQKHLYSLLLYIIILYISYLPSSRSLSLTLSALSSPLVLVTFEMLPTPCEQGSALTVL